MFWGQVPRDTHLHELADASSHPRQYRRSSYRISAEGKASSLIVPHDQYRALGRSAESRRAAYRALFQGPLEQTVTNEIRSATTGGFVLGRPRFAEEIARMLGRRVARGKPGRPPRTNDGIAA
jgi:putative transposase